MEQNKIKIRLTKYKNKNKNEFIIYGGIIMKKNIKKIIPIIAIASLVTTSVFANNKIKGETTTIEKSNENKNFIYIDGEMLENASLIEKDNKKLMPVRAIFEKLGYEIQYNPEDKTIIMLKGPHYITFSTTKDAYTFSKMMPQPLGLPIVKDGVTYVPVELLDLVGIDMELMNNNLYIGEKAKENRKEQIIIKEIDDNGKTILVEDPKMGEVSLNIENLKIKYNTQEKELMVGQAIEVEYGDTMTKSLPPINTPKSVKVVDKFSYGEILNVEKDEKGNLSILFDDEEIGEVVLYVPKNFKIKYETEEKELMVGQTIEVVLDNAMTMSLPPINNPKSISVIESSKNEMVQDSEQSIKGKAIIKISNKEEKTILVDDEEMGEVVLNLHEDLKVENKKGEDLKNTNWIVGGKKIEVEYSPIMTRSLPPINNPIKITILD